MSRLSGKPNVVVVFTDQQRWDTMGVHGNPLDLTPNFDRMAMEGTHAFNAFSCQPVCGPARACLQTGTYATTNGCWRNSIPLPQNARTLAHHFRDAGYRTGYIGKWHLASGNKEPVREQERGGYEYWLASNVIEFTSDKYNCVVYDNDCKPVKLPGYRVDALTDAAIRYIDLHQNDPFFLFLSFSEPHQHNYNGEYPAPDGYAERYSGRWLPPDLAALPGDAIQHIGGYFGMVKRLDEALGRLLEALKSLGLLNNTIVHFSSDHGCHFRTRNKEYKRSCHDSSIRIPMAFQGPGFDGGGRIRQMVSLVDVAPTLLDAAGLPLPAHMQGRSILPLTRGETEGWPEEAFIQISESQTGRAIRTRRWTYGVTSSADGKRGAPAADRYVEEYLYDLEADPYQLTNHAGRESHRSVADELRRRLILRMVEAGEAQPVIEPAPSRKAGQLRLSPRDIVI